MLNADLPPTNPFDDEKVLAEAFDHLKAAVIAVRQPQLDAQARAAALDQHAKGFSSCALRICAEQRRRLNQLLDQVQDAQITLRFAGCADDWQRILAPLWAEARRLEPDGLDPVPALPGNLPDRVAAEQARHDLESWTRSQSQWVQTIAMLAGTANAHAGRLPPDDPAVRHAIESYLDLAGSSGVIWLQPPADPAVRHSIESSFRQLNEPSGVITPPPPDAASQEPILVPKHVAIEMPDDIAIELDKWHAAAGRPQEPTPLPNDIAIKVRKLYAAVTYPQEPILLPNDSAILKVLQTSGVALTGSKIAAELLRLHLEQRQAGESNPTDDIGVRTIETRVKFLLEHGLVTRPKDTPRKGVAITEKGRQKLTARP